MVDAFVERVAGLVQVLGQLQCGGAQVVEGALVVAPVEVHGGPLHPAQVLVPVICSGPT